MKPAPNRLVLANYPLTLDVPARFADLDPNQHLNNVAIGQFYEEGRADFAFRLIRSVAKEAGARHPRLLLAHVAISYLAEGRYPAMLRVGTGVVKLGRTSFTYGQALFWKDRCIGVADSVAVNSGEGGVTALPKDVREALKGLTVAGSPAATAARSPVDAEA